MLIELIFKGAASKLDYSFLRTLSYEARNIYFVSPEIDLPNNLDQIVNIINSYDYIDLAISTDHLKINEKVIPRVFANVGRNDDEIEVLLFFDLLDLKEPSPKANIDFLRNWTEQFQKEYNFKYFICQMDAADDDEYYFDNFGQGKLYDDIK